MASEALIRNHIDGIVASLSEEMYREWIGNDLQDIENNRNSVNGGFRSDLIGLTNESSTLAEALRRFSNTTIYDYSKSLNEIVLKMGRYQEVWERFQRRVTRTLDTTSQLCREFEENIGDYLPEIEVSEVIAQMEKEPLSATLPVIGLVEIGFNEMEQRISRLGFDDLDSYIESRINTTDYSGFPLRTKELTQDCFETRTEIEAFKEKIEAKHLSDLNMLQPLAAEALNHLSMLSVKSSPLISRFSKALTEVLGLAHSIEVEQPDISRDIIFAKLLSACDSGNREKINEIAEILGLEMVVAESMDSASLCKILIESNFG